MGGWATLGLPGSMALPQTGGILPLLHAQICVISYVSSYESLGELCSTHQPSHISHTHTHTKEKLAQLKCCFAHNPHSPLSNRKRETKTGRNEGRDGGREGGRETKEKLRRLQAKFNHKPQCPLLLKEQKWEQYLSSLLIPSMTCLVLCWTVNQD